MASAPEDSKEALRNEYEALSRQASSLAMALARRRADVALMRAEAATVAVSLEAAKERLDDLLRKESVIRTRAPPSSMKEKPRADFAPDKALVRSLAGQLDVTQKSVKEALVKKVSMSKEIDELERLLSAKDDGPESHLLHGGDDVVYADATNSEPPHLHLGARQHDADFSGSRPSSGSFSVMEQASPSRKSVAQDILDGLRKGAQSSSSFRTDHARIWRDATMPNLALVPMSDHLSSGSVSFGVVLERIFEGVTCFSPSGTAEKRRRSADMRIEGSTTVQRAESNVAAAVASHFAALSFSLRDDLRQVRMFAPKIALMRVMQLISDDGADRLKPPQLHLRTEEDERGRDSIERNEYTESVLSSGGNRSPRRRSRNANITVKLLDASHVLHIDHFKQIIAQGVPVRFHGSALELAYSTNVHGISLHTLFSRVKTTSPTLIAIRDTENRVFGCYAATSWKSSATRYYGTGESFVFGADGPNVAKVYKWSRENSFFQFASSTFLAIGGGAGSHFALWIDEDLLMGTTSSCSTFASPPLTCVNIDDPPTCVEFKIVSLEVWTFNAHIIAQDEGK